MTKNRATNSLLQAICVFCGSYKGGRSSYPCAAKKMGNFLATTQRTLVYGGGRIGLMGMIADAVLSKKGLVVGVIPQALVKKEQAHPNLSKLEIVKDMHERKARMFALSDAFIALPGGLGTYEELFEVLSWSQIQLHKKPCGLLNVQGFFDPLLKMLEKTVEEGFIRKSDLSLLVVEKTPEKLLNALESYDPIWIDKGSAKDPFQIAEGSF